VFERGERPVVIDHDVGARPFQLRRHLGRNHVHRFCLAKSAVPNQSLESEITGSVDEKDSVELPAQVALEEKGDVGDDDAITSFARLLHQAITHSLDFRMHDGVEVLELLRLGEDNAAEGGAVEMPVGRKDRLAPPLDNAVVPWRTHLDRLPRQYVGVDDRRAALGQHSRNGRLPTRDIAGQPDEEHGAKLGCSAEGVNATFPRSLRTRTNVTKHTKDTERTVGATEASVRLPGGDGARLREFETLVRRELELLGEDPERPGIVKTPHRVAKALCWLTRGYRQRVEDIIGDALFVEEHQNMVMVRDIELYSLCEHHLLPFFGRAHVAYIPNGRIVGLSKLPRIVEVYARRLQVQERLTEEIAEAIDQVLRPAGVGVVIEAVHLCTRMRGVEKQNSKMITSALRGLFRDDARTRAEFLDLAHAHAGGVD
jgi:GTP cyclohydrolase I